MHTAYLGLGSNLNDPIQQVKKTILSIEKLDNVSVEAQSMLYVNPPLGALNQPDYVNTVLKITTSLSAHQLLERIHELEHDMGRVRREKWGSRIIDIDILLFDNLYIQDPKLTLPHPGITERAFFACLVHEISPNLNLPDGTKIADIAHRLGRHSLNPIDDVWLKNKVVEQQTCLG